MNTDLIPENRNSVLNVSVHHNRSRLFRNLQRVKLEPFSMDRPLQKRVHQHLGLSETDPKSIKNHIPGVCNIISPLNTKLVGDFNPSEKYESQIGSSSQLGKIKVTFQTTNHQDTNQVHLNFQGETMKFPVSPALPHVRLTARLSKASIPGLKCWYAQDYVYI